MSDFAAFARGSICSTFIDSVPLIEIARATSIVEMALSVLMDRRKEWEDTFTKKFGVPVDGEVGLPKMIGAFCVMAQCSLDVEGVGFVKTAPPPTPALEPQELKKVVEDQRMAMEGLRKVLVEVSAKSQAAAKRKMASVPPLGAPQAQCARSATIWASGRTRDPYFEILGTPSGIMVTPSGGFDFRFCPPLFGSPFVNTVL